VKIIAITFKAFLDTPVQWPIIFQSLGKSSMNILLIIIVNDDFRFYLVALDLFFCSFKRSKNKWWH